MDNFAGGHHGQGLTRPVVLGFFAHPDDETLSAGGLLALLAEHCDVHIITATRGEMGEIVAPEGERTHPDRNQLPLTRTSEVRQACAYLGVKSHEFLDGGDGRFTDSGMAWEDERRIRAIADPAASADAFSLIDIDEPARALAARIVELRPTLLITEEPAGGYGHPDHIRCHDVTMRAVEIAQEHWKVPLVSFAVQERARAKAANIELSRLEQVPSVDAYGLDLHRPDPASPLHTGVTANVDVVIDTRSATPRVARAMSAHATQVHEVALHAGEHLGGWFALTNNDLKPIPVHGALVLAPGWGTRPELGQFLAAIGLYAPPPRLGNSKLYTGFLLFFALFSGVIAGFVGSFTHRSSQPWGLVLALVTVLAGAVLNRTMGSLAAAYAYTGSLIVSVMVLTMRRSGGDVVVAGDAVGLGWLVGIFLMSFIGVLLGGALSGSSVLRGRALGSARARD